MGEEERIRRDRGWAEERQWVKGTKAGWKAGRRLESLPHNKNLPHKISLPHKEVCPTETAWLTNRACFTSECLLDGWRGESQEPTTGTRLPGWQACAVV